MIYWCKRFEMRLSIFLIIVCLTITNGYAQEKKTEIIDSSSGSIEIYLQKPNKEKFPFLLFLHGASTDLGIVSISQDWFDHWIDKGYAVGAISMPGFGSTSGIRDFCGPVTIQTLHFAIDTILKRLEVSDLGIIGFGQGGLAAILLSLGRDDIKYITSINGSYDLQRHLHTDDILIRGIQARNYALPLNEKEFEIRSPRAFVSLIKTPIFILHREDNPIVNTDEVMSFVEAMRHLNKECAYAMMKKTPESDVQKLSFDEIIEETEDWMDTHL